MGLRGGALSRCLGTVHGLTLLVTDDTSPNLLACGVRVQVLVS
jgi:hypothetical protein